MSPSFLAFLAAGDGANGDTRQRRSPLAPSAGSAEPTITFAIPSDRPGGVALRQGDMRGTQLRRPSTGYPQSG
jgi:hypothetical protein